jgi:outer membrane protein TolC
MTPLHGTANEPHAPPARALTRTARSRLCSPALVSRAGAALALLALATASPAIAQTATLVPAPRRALSLEEALRLAEPASETLLLARAAELRAEGQRDVARGTLLPRLDGFANYTRTFQTQFSRFFAPDTTGNVAGNLPFGQPNTWSFGLTAQQTLFNLGAIAAWRSVNQSREKARLDFGAQRAQVILDVTRAYYDAVLADRLLQIAESTLAQTERTLKDVTLGREVGTQPEFDQLRATVARDNQKPIVIQRRTQRISAFARLAQLLNLPAREPLELVTPLGEQPGAPLPAFAQAVADARDTSVAARAPVKSAELFLKAQESALKAVLYQRLPTLKLTSTYTQFAYPRNTFPGNGDFVDDWFLTARVDVPIFTGGRLRGDGRNARAARDEAEARLRQAREQAEREQLESDSQLEGAEAAWEASRGAADQARRAYEIAEVRFKEGISTQTELSDARLQLQQAEANRAQAARDLQVARIRVLLLPALPFESTGGAPPATAQTFTPSAAQANGQNSGGAGAAPGTITGQP